MDSSKPLSDFFAAIKTDGRIGTTHISIYAALLTYRIDKGFVNPIKVFARDIRHMSKICAPITYHKCIKELSEYGYIRYEPSFNKNEGSRVYFQELQ